MYERIRGSYDYALYKSTYTLLYFIKNKDHAGDEEFRGHRSSHLEQFTSRPANRNSLAIDVRSTSECPPVRLIDSASEDHLCRALQIYLSSSSSSRLQKPTPAMFFLSNVTLTLNLLTQKEMSFQDPWCNVSVSSSAILTAAVFEISSRK